MLRNFRRPKGNIETNKQELHVEEKYFVMQQRYFSLGMCRAACQLRRKIPGNGLIFPRLRRIISSTFSAAKQLQNVFFFHKFNIFCRETVPKHFISPQKGKRCSSPKPWRGKPHQALHLVVPHAQFWRNLCASATFHHLFPALVPGALLCGCTLELVRLRPFLAS